jgi:hypothetical protein
MGERKESDIVDVVVERFERRLNLFEQHIVSGIKKSLAESEASIVRVFQSREAAEHAASVILQDRKKPA